MGHASRFVVVFNDGRKNPNPICALMRLENTFLKFIRCWKSMVKPAFSFLPQHGLFEVKDRREDTVFSNEEMQFFVGFIEHFPTVKALYLAKVRSFNSCKKGSIDWAFTRDSGTGTKPLSRSDGSERHSKSFLMLIMASILKPGNSLVQPPVDHLVNFFAQDRILPIEVWLILVKEWR